MIFYLFQEMSQSVTFLLFIKTSFGHFETILLLILLYVSKVDLIAIFDIKINNI